MFILGFNLCIMYVKMTRQEENAALKIVNFLFYRAD